MSFRAAPVLLLVLPVIASAHHSRAHYSSEVSEMIGEFVAIDWGNPHVFFRFRETDSTDDTVWLMEASSLYALKRGGISRDMLKVGERVRVAGRISNTRPNEYGVTNILRPSGQEIVILSGASPRWSDEAIGSRDNWVADVDRLLGASSDQEGLFKVWSVPKDQIVVSHLPFTEAAIASRADWDPDDNYVMRCEQKGMPKIIGGGQPHPIEFIDKGDTLVFRSEEFDIVRNIHMDQTSIPDDEPHSRLGYSIGEWEDDNTLVVYTARINWPYFDGNGTRQTEQVEAVERFSLSEDGRELIYHLTVTDPETFTEPATMERKYLALGETVEPYECEPI